MKTPKKCRNRRDSKLKAVLILAAGPDRRVWLTRFCAPLPEFAAQLGLTAAEAAARADEFRT